MSNVRSSLAAIAAIPLSGRVRVLHLCGDQERVIALSDMRNLLPANVELLAGPGCAASVCPEEDVYQALRLLESHDVTMLVGENLLRLPLTVSRAGYQSLYEAMRDGARVATVETPMHAVAEAQAEPARDFVYFVAGFETLLAPLAGMIVQGLPDNLSVLVCGRRAEPLVAALLADGADRVNGLLLPGNRCAVTGTEDWDRLSVHYRKPAAVAGYSTVNILSALHAILVQHARGAARVDNHYRGFARPGGNAFARDQMERVFEPASSKWRGLGEIAGTGYRLRRAYDDVNADRRYHDYRVELPGHENRMPLGCECAAVLRGEKRPVDCPLFASRCTPLTPHGPCMASEDGTCFLQRNTRNVA